MKIVNSPGTSTLNYLQVLSVLKSKDLQAPEVLKFEEDVKKYGSRFFD